MATYERVKKNGKMTDRWKVRYRDTKDENPKSLSAPDEKTAKALSGKIEAWHAMHPGVPYPRNGEDKPAPVALAMLDDVIVAYCLDLKRTAKPRSVAAATQALRLFLRHVGLDAKASALSLASISSFDSMRASAEIAPSTRVVALGFIKRCWTWAWERRESYIGLTEPRTIAKPTVIAAPTVAPRWAESAACISHLDPASSGWKRAIVAYYTGLRTFQLSGMVYADRLEHEGATRSHTTRLSTCAVTAIVYLEGEHAGHMRVILGKTDQETAMRRLVPLAPGLLCLLRQWHAEDPRPRVCRGDETAAVAQITMAWRLATASGQARAEAYGPSVVTGRIAFSPCHAFRRGLITGLKGLGADNEAVEHYVGHAMPGVRGAYLDACALTLGDALAKIPAIPSVERLYNRRTEQSNVVAFPAAGAL